MGREARRGRLRLCLRRARGQNARGACFRAFARSGGNRRS